MNPDRIDPIVRWRRAERNGDADLADQAFRALAGSWPRHAAPPRLVRGVMRRLATADRVAPWTRWWVRATVAGVLLLAGTVLSWQPTPTALALGRSVWDGVTGGLHWLLLAAATWTEAASAVLKPLATAVRVAAPMLTQPGPALFCVLNILLSAGALAVLRRLMMNREV